MTANKRDNRTIRDEMAKAHDKWIDRARKCAAGNLKKIRTHFFGKMAMEPFSGKIDTAVATYHKWESGEAVPDAPRILLLMDVLANEGIPFSFTLDEFYTTELSFEKEPSEAVSIPELSPYIGAYLGYAFAEAGGQAPGEFPALRYYVFFCLPAMEEKDAPLKVLVQSFDDPENARLFKEDLDGLNPRGVMEEELILSVQDAFAAYAGGYRGYADFLDRDFLIFNLKKSDGSDAITLLSSFAQPSADDFFHGGPSLMLHLTDDGCNRRPTAQKLLLTDTPMDVSREFLTKALQMHRKTPDLFDAIEKALKHYAALNEHRANNGYLSEEDCIAVEAHRLGRTLREMNESVNDCCLELYPEDFRQYEQWMKRRFRQ